MCACQAGHERNKKNDNTFSIDREVPAPNGYDEDAGKLTGYEEDSVYSWRIPF